MAVICDTGGVYAMHDADDAHHAEVKSIDQRHFRAIVPRHLSRFVLLPADAH